MSVQENKSQAGEPGSFPVRDVHVHCYPAEVISDPVEWARLHREPHWGQLVTEGPQGWADPETLIRQMDLDGIETVLLQSWYWENPDTMRLQNDWHADWIQRFPDRLKACAAIHPDYPDPVAILNEAEEWGACAVGECLPRIQTGESWAHPAWDEVINWTTAKGWPVCMHVTEPVGHVYPGRVETSLMELVALFERTPMQKWICAHWGGGLPFFALNRRVGKVLDNVWFDTAASPLLYDSRIWQIACDLVGAEKILFGSDFPLRLYPRSEKLPAWNRFLKEFNESGLTTADRRRIAGDTFDLLFGKAQLSPDA